MHRPLLSFVLSTIALLVTGCARLPLMPLADEGTRVDASKPLYLMSVTIQNDYRKRWQPRVLNLLVAKDEGAAKPDLFGFRMDSRGVVESEEDDGATTYLVRFTTEGRPFIVWGINAMGSAFPIHGRYFVPLQSPLPASEPAVHYLGAVKARIRERQENEFRAGPLIPLLDQAIAGASTGTFEIDIVDAYSSDTELFRKTFPSLTGIEIRRSILQPWDRAKLQRLWEDQ